MTMAVGAAAVGQADATSGGTIALTGLTPGRGLVLTVFLESTVSAPITFVATYNTTETLTIIGTPQYNTTSHWSVWQAYLPALSATSGNLTYSFVGTNFPNDASYAIVKEIYDTVTGGIAIDASGGTTGSSTDPTFNVVTGSSGSLLIGGLSSAASLTLGSGFSDNGSIAWWIGEWSEYQILGAAGTYAFNWTGAISQWVGSAAAFKASGSSATPITGSDSEKLGMTEASAVRALIVTSDLTVV